MFIERRVLEVGDSQLELEDLPPDLRKRIKESEQKKRKVASALTFPLRILSRMNCSMTPISQEAVRGDGQTNARDCEGADLKSLPVPLLGGRSEVSSRPKEGGKLKCAVLQFSHRFSVGIMARNRQNIKRSPVSFLLG
jgi:hypothetical protein